MTAKPNPVVAVGKAKFGNRLPLALIAGPCALESRAFKPERSPDRAATKSLAEIEPSTRSPRQSNCPVAANEREIDGQASERSISPSFSETWLAASS